jgi:hypothetical protein
MVVFVQDYMDFVNEGEFACHAKLNPAPTMTVCLPQKVIHPVKRSNQSFLKTRMFLVQLGCFWFINETSTILVADKCRDIQGYWSKGTLTVYKGYTAYQGYVAYFNVLLIISLSPVSQLVSFPSTLSLSLNNP